METTIDQLKHLIANELDVNIQLAEIGPDVPLLEDGLGLDSIAIVELITLIEEKFAVEFSEDELNMEAFANIRTLSQWIEQAKTPVYA